MLQRKKFRILLNFYGIYSLIVLDKIFISFFVWAQSDKLWEFVAENSLLWLTAPHLIGSQIGQNKLFLKWQTNL